MATLRRRKNFYKRSEDTDMGRSMLRPNEEEELPEELEGELELARRGGSAGDGTGRGAWRV